jgi:hypothetical protein
MRRLYALALASCLWALPSAFCSEGAAAVAQIIRPSSESERELVLEAAFVCGMTDGKFGCKSVSGGTMQHGKSATPGINNVNPSDDVPEGTTGEQGAATPAGNTGHGAQSGVGAQEAVKLGEHACPPGYRVLAVPTRFGYCEPPGTPEVANTTCQHGMVGTPPNGCHCPKNSELLGGNCIHYTATCRNGLAADFTPQPCAGAEEKLACKVREDGLKDCCCLTYDKL